MVAGLRKFQGSLREGGRCDAWAGRGGEWFMGMGSLLVPTRILPPLGFRLVGGSRSGCRASALQYGIYGYGCLVNL